MQEDLSALSDQLEGDLHYDSLLRTLYATDASVYRELPLAVALPKSSSDLRHIINFAHRHKTSLIPRAAGTSLAGQCVGEGIVVDMGRYMDQILEINPQEKWVRVQPGVIRDQLNEVLRPHCLFFGPNTSTANRCMIGGMVGNNACGSTSIIYGSTRDHVLELEAMLSDGSQATFTSLSSDEFQQKLNGNTLEYKVYQQIHEALVQEEIQDEINKEFPRPAIKRRNTGFAVDLLLRQQPFHKKGEPFNFSTLLCGSEG
ncbi:MAG: FAD-binding oxidoreductase, partial [Saprospiraceae bacterium]|nr:FAD-binding oxidoreductase [Saprospiraceae bacterium]